MILRLMGESPVEVSAVGAAFLQHEVSDVTTTHLQFSAGRRAHVFVSWLHHFKEPKLVVVSEKGMLTFNDVNDWSNKVEYYPHTIDWNNNALVHKRQ